MRRNNRWTGVEKWQAKKKSSAGQTSSFFLEGMSDTEIEEMISEAFMKKVVEGREWYGDVSYNGKTIRVRGYLDGNSITSAFIELIN